MQNYGSLREEEVNGRIITILPTCDVPLEHLLEENWRRTWSDEPVKCSSNSYGHFRFVWNVQRLASGEKISIYVKHPERIFTTDTARLEKGYIWWGGPRSGEGQPIYLRHPLVEEQTLWQAVYLLELHKQGIPAEVPLAIVEWPNGSELGDSELILQDVGKYNYGERFSLANLDSRLNGLVPEDLGGHNIITPQYRENAKPAIIDVNRWLWLPYTDEWKKALVEYVRKEVRIKTVNSDKW